MKLLKNKKPLLLFSIIACLVAFDIVTSRTKDIIDPVVDTFFSESGEEMIDGYDAVSGASITTHVSLITSQHAGLSFSKGSQEDLTPAEIREMVLRALSLDKHWGTSTSELKYKINAFGANCWVALLPNLCFYPGYTYTLGDQTDPRIIQAVFDYIADSTNAQRISLLAGGSYSGFSGEFDIFERSEFYGSRWNSYFPGLSSTFSFKTLVEAARARNPGKTIEYINSNYNEIMDNGLPYNEIPDSERVGRVPQIYPVPTDNKIGLGALATANTISGTGYNPTDAVLHCNILVNIPVMKTTRDVIINCVQKNYIGTVSRATYANTVYGTTRSSSLSLLDHDLLAKTVANLFSYHPSDYCIVDALASLEGDGSHPDAQRTGFLKRNFILAGSDPIAVDAVGCLTMNLNPLDIEILRWGTAKGFGTLFPDQIAVVGDSVDMVKTDVMAPIKLSGTYANFTASHYYGRGCRRWLLLGPFSSPDIDTLHISETSADPYEGDQENGHTWTPYYSPADYIDMLDPTLPATAANSVTYAFTRIYSKTAQPARLYIGGLRDLRVHVNGVEALDTTGLLTYSRVAFLKDVQLNEGDNSILVKIRRSGSEYGFSIAAVTSGTATMRTSYVPHTWGSLGNPVTLSAGMKMSYFGDRTVPNTFYHLGANVAIEKPRTIATTKATLSGSPNPFNSTVAISFTLPGNAAPVRIDVFDASGKKIKALFSGPTARQNATILWNGRDAYGKSVVSGVYFVRLASGSTILTHRLVYLK